MRGMNQRLRLAALLATAAWLGTTTGAWATDPLIGVTPTSNHPQASTEVDGFYFGVDEAVDIYFDTTDEALAVTNSKGNFGKTAIGVPANATPGTHTITAVGRHSGLAAQKTFTVNTDWAEFHFDHKLKGLNPWENVLNPSNVSSLDEAWTGATNNFVESSPAVVGGVAYVGSYDSYVYTFNAATGAPGWSFNMSGAVTSSPAVANGLVYAAGANGAFVALNATTGKLVWHATLGAGSVYSSPVVANGIVYIGCDDYNLYAFNASTGALLWTAPTENTINDSPAVSNGVVYIGSTDNNLYAFNATTGAFVWKAATANSIFLSSPVVANGTVYIGSDDDSLYAFAADSGTQIWRQATADQINSSVAVANDAVYLNTAGDVYAFSADSGAEIWGIAFGTDDQASSPAVANGVVYLATCNYSGAPTVDALNATTGTVLWSAATGGGCITSSPAVANGMVYVGSDDDNVYAYALNGGNDPVYKKKHKAPAISSLHPDWSLKPTSAQ